MRVYDGGPLMATTMKLIAKSVLSSTTATVTFSSIPSTYTDLYLVVSARGTRSDTQDAFNIGFNGSTSNFSNRYLSGNGAIAGSGGFAAINQGVFPAANAGANIFGSLEMYIPNYAGSTNKSWSSTTVLEANATTAYIDLVAGLWSQAAAISSIEVDALFGSFASGSSFYLYGITKS